MKKEELYEAIGDIDEKWIQEAQDKVVTLDEVSTQRKKHRKILGGVVAAAVLAVVIAPNLSVNIARAYEKVPVLQSIAKVVVLRNYDYSEGNYQADVTVPKVNVEEGSEDNTNQTLKESAENINESVEALTNNIIAEFKEKVASDNTGSGMGSVDVNYEVVTDTDKYFVLKIWQVETAGDSAETDYYYTIDRSTGKEISLSDLFTDDSYVDTITDEIKDQMRQQMKEDDNKIYWIDQDDDMFEFKSIAKDQSFYINSDGHLVISFNEGDVAPMYMGSVTFIMPEGIWNAK